MSGPPGDPTDPDNPGMGMYPDVPDPDAPPTEKGDGNPNAISADVLFACTDQTGPAGTEARLRRFSVREWEVRIQTRNHGHDAPLQAPPANRYSTLTAGDVFNDSSLQRMIDVATKLSKEWTKKLEHSIRNCFKEDVNAEPFDDECKRNAVTSATDRLWRIRPSSEERARFEQALEEEFAATQSREQAARFLFKRIILSPRSIYRFELGEGEELEDGSGRRRLAGFELAEALSYALSNGNLKGEGHGEANRALFEAARDGELETEDQIREHVRALLWHIKRDRDTKEITETRPAEKTQRFWRELLQYSDAADVIKEDPAATSRYTTKVSSTFVSTANKASNLLNSQVWRIMKQDERVLERLMTVSTVDVENGGPGNPVALINKVLNVADLETGLAEEGKDVDLSSERRGVMTHPAWLMQHGHNRENDGSLIYRGKWIYENLLCGVIPPIPIDVAAVLPEEDGWSARKRVAYATQPLASDTPEEAVEKEYCWSCHKLMNPLGEPFEIYNHAGFVRESDHGNPPDGSSTLISTGDPMLDGVEITDALDLMERLSTSPVVEQCFVRQTFRYYMGRPERAEDACTLSSMLDTYRAHDGSFTEMLVALFMSDSFLYRYDRELEVQESGEEEEEGY